jgi:hypothetical protein
MDFPEDADMKPPRDYPISLGAYFFDVQDSTSIKILRKFFASERGG